MPVILGGNTGIYLASLTPAVDPDAQAFITAASITNPTQQSAINQLVVDLKGYGIWTKMKALYPFVGGTASTHKFNLKDPRDLDAAFRLVFNGGVTHSSNGVQGNGTNGYADTKLIPSTILQSTNAHQSYYFRNILFASRQAAYGCEGTATTATNRFSFFPNSFSVGWISDIYDNSQSRIISNSGNTTGFLVSTRASSSSHKLFRNNTQLASTTNNTNGSRPTINYYIGAYNASNVPSFFDSLQLAFASIGDGLSDTEAANFYTAVQTFQTTLSRNV